MEKLLNAQKIGILKLYFQGCTYQEIADQIEVSKGSVSNVVADFRDGKLLEVQEPAEQLELLREIAVELRRLNIRPDQGVGGAGPL